MSALALAELGAATVTPGASICAVALHRARATERLLNGRIAQATASYRPVTDRRNGRSRGSGNDAARTRVVAWVGVPARSAWLAIAVHRRVVLIAAGGAPILALVAWHVAGPIGLLAGPALWLGMPRLWLRRAARRRAAILFRQFPDALAIIVRAVRVGVPVSAALSIVAQDCAEPTATEFRHASEEIAIGRSLADALLAMASRTGATEYRFFATALALQAQTGGGLTETLETLADTIRRRVAIRERGHALASEARMTCYILGALPFVLTAVMSLLSPAYTGILFVTGRGHALLAAAGLLLGAGLLAMRVITRRALD